MSHRTLLGRFAACAISAAMQARMNSRYDACEGLKLPGKGMMLPLAVSPRVDLEAIARTFRACGQGRIEVATSI